MGEPRVLLLLGPSTGGIRRHVAYLAERLSAAGWGVEVAGPHGVMDGVGRQDHDVAVPSTPGLAALRARRALLRAAGRADIVHAHGLKAGWLAASLGRGGPPVVVTVHNLVLDEVAGRTAPLLRAAEGLLPQRVDTTIAVSREIARRFTRQSGGGRVVVIPPAAAPAVARRGRDDVRAELRVGDAPLVVSVARLHPQKDLTTLVRAAAGLRARIPDVRVVIVGDGPLAAELRAEVLSLDLEGCVSLVGARPDAVDVLAAADAVVVSSLWESGPIVALEALQLGRPLVSTPVGLVPDLVEPGVHGVLVPVGDPVAMAAGLGAVLTDHAAAARMAAAGRARVTAELDPEALVSRVADVYRATLSR